MLSLKESLFGNSMNNNVTQWWEACCGVQTTSFMWFELYGKKSQYKFSNLDDHLHFWVFPIRLSVKWTSVYLLFVVYFHSFSLKPSIHNLLNSRCFNVFDSVLKFYGKVMTCLSDRVTEIPVYKSLVVN